MVEQTKKCNTCGEVKGVSLFNKNRTRSDGLQDTCKACRKAYYEANREAILVKRKVYREANREAILVRKRAYWQANREANKAYKKANRGLYSELQAARKAKEKKNTPKFIRECPVDKQRRVFAYNLARLLTETTGVEHHVDHMWPISDGGPHWSGNLQVIPAVDNLSKNATVDVEIKKTIKEGLKYARQAYKKELEERSHD